MTSFHDRAPLSDIESDGEMGSQSAPSVLPSAVPIPDTGFKPMTPSTRETRQTKRRASQETAVSAPADKKSRTKGDSTINIARRIDRIEETLQDILKSVRGLTTAIDNLKTTVTAKMTAVETKLGVQQDRIESLQAARRDGFLNTLGMDTTNPHPMPSVPHYVQATPPPTRCQMKSSCVGPSSSNPLSAFWPDT